MSNFESESAQNRSEPRPDRASVEEILTVADLISAFVKGTHLDHGTLLYDEKGIPG